MKKTLILLAAGVLLLVTACSNKDPRHQGERAGKASCECYKLGTQEEIERCLDEVMEPYAKYVTDTTFTNAMEHEMLQCITQGVVDFDKPLRETEPVDEEMEEEELEIEVEENTES